MATHDYVIANGTGAAVRSDLNGALAAIVSNNSSATEPATMYAYQWWPDTTTGLLKIRNSANSAWVTIGTLASTNLGLLSLAGGTMTGVLAVTAGTAALPGIAVSGDLNTGIYSPGADQVGIATGGTSRLAVSTTAVSSTLAVDVPLGAVGTPSITFTGDLNTGIYSPGADQLAISTNGTGRLFIASDGKVGVGAAAAANINFDVSGSSPRIRVVDPSTGFALNHYQNTSGDFYVGIDNSTGSTFGGSVAYQRVLYGTGAYPFSIFTNSARALTIDSSQRLLVGTIASPAHQLQVSTDSAGKPSTSTWTIVSDERIKEDIELADLDLCYEAIKAIPLKRYKWRDEIYTTEQVTDRRKLGWIAQDVEAVFPKAVGTHDFKYNQVFEKTIIPAVEEELDADGNVITPAQPERTEQGDLISEDVIEDCRNLNSDQIYAAMYGAVQKLMAKVEALETSNADLLARVAALEAA